MLAAKQNWDTLSWMTGECSSLMQLMKFIVGENGPSKWPRLALCASLGWFADF